MTNVEVSEMMEMKMAPIMLLPWHEVVGPLIKLEEQFGALIVEIGKIRLMLPLEMKEQLSPLLGKNVGLLSTDISDKKYIMRVLPEIPR
jgi:hypothetical protein